MKIDKFRTLVQSVLREVKEERKKTSDKNNYLDGTDSQYKQNVNNDVDTTVESLVSKIKTVVSRIDKKITVKLDDHNDIMVVFVGVFTIRVRPNWSGNFNIEAYRNMTDRVYAVGLTDNQIIDFIKVNFNKNQDSYIQTAYNKIIKNRKDATKKDKDLPKTEIVKVKELTKTEKVKTSGENKQTPSDPMETVDAKKLELQSDHKVEKNKEMPKIQKMIKRENA